MSVGAFWFYFLGMGACEALHDKHGTSFFGLAALASGWLLPFMVAAWVVSDAQRRERKLCYDFDSFIFFAGILVAPYYLFSTRKWRAFITLAWILAMYAARVVAYFVSGEIFSR